MGGGIEAERLRWVLDVQGEDEAERERERPRVG